MDRTTYEPDVVPWLVDRGYQVVNVDLRGHGRSSWADDYRAGAHAADVADLVVGLSVGKVIVVGHSLGGVVGAALGSARPELVKGLFLEDPPLFYGDDEIRMESEVFKRNHDFGSIIREYQSSGVSSRELAEQMADLPFRYPGETMLGFHGADGLTNWANAIISCDPSAVDTLFHGRLWGDFDPTAPIPQPVTVLAADPRFDGVFVPEHGQRLVSSVPHANIVAVPGASHEIHKPRSALDTYLVEMDRFLDSVRSTTRT